MEGVPKRRRPAQCRRIGERRLAGESAGKSCGTQTTLRPVRGDSVCAIPSIRSISNTYKNAKVDILTNTGSKGLSGLSELLKTSDYNEIIDYNGFF